MPTEPLSDAEKNMQWSRDLHVRQLRAAPAEARQALAAVYMDTYKLLSVAQKIPFTDDGPRILHGS